MKKTAIAAAIALSMAGGAVHADKVATYLPVATNGNNFTMLQPDGSSLQVPAGPGATMQGGTNDVKMTWDGTLYDSISDYTGLTSVGNMTLTSDETFSGSLWTAHNIQVFGPGTYSFDTTNPGGTTEVGNITMTVDTGQIGVHMLFDWGSPVPNLNIDVVNVWDLDGVFGSGKAWVADATECQGAGYAKPTVDNCLWDGKDNGLGNDSGVLDGSKPAGNNIWSLVSTDDNGDGTPGVPMTGPPFAAFNANFNLDGFTLTAVPVPAAVWLFGSGLLGLVGVARRKKVV